mmetsp:Transcript_58603/g.169619  ORF Transcript_58603/g.169619 Transcript_58603/m.169619 type:complete len:218 (+) Transcript_58603:546-1199(+)
MAVAPAVCCNTCRQQPAPAPSAPAAASGMAPRRPAATPTRETGGAISTISGKESSVEWPMPEFCWTSCNVLRTVDKPSICCECCFFMKFSKSTMLAWMSRTMRLTPTMSLRRASPRSIAMPSTNSSKSMVPDPSVSSVRNKFSLSSSAKSKSSKSSCTRGSARTHSKRAGVISIQPMRSVSEPNHLSEVVGTSGVMPCSSSWMSHTTFSSLAIFRAK